MTVVSSSVNQRRVSQSRRERVHMKEAEFRDYDQSQTWPSQLAAQRDISQTTSEYETKSFYSET